MTDTPQSQETAVRALRPFTFYLLALIVFVSDQASKAWVTRRMVWEESRPLEAPFRITLTQNHGGAWGVLPQGNGVFIVFAAVAVALLLVAYHRMKQIDLLVGAAFALALGGALGNLLDRLHYGYVVDFFDARIIHFPIFNIADSAITLGIGLLLWYFAQSARLEKLSSQKAVEVEQK